MRQWDMSATLSMVIDDKHDFDMKVGSDNIKKSCLVRDNRQGIA